MEQNVGLMWDRYLAELVEEHYACDEDEEYCAYDEDDVANNLYDEMGENR